MKTIISVVLITALACAPLNLDATPPPPQNPPGDTTEGERRPKVNTSDSWALAAIVLTAAAVGAYIVLKVHSKYKISRGPVTLVLESSADNANWLPVATNTVVLNGQEPMEAFRDVRRDFCKFYRVRVER